MHACGISDFPESESFSFYELKRKADPKSSGFPVEEKEIQ
jgi:hypothetical protein